MPSSFRAPLSLLGINPFVFVPPAILKKIFTAAGKEKGFIPIHGTVNKKRFKQTLVKYKGEWRLYINTSILANSPKRIGETIRVTVAFDPEDRSVPMHSLLNTALKKNAKASRAYEKQSPSRKKEINRYLHGLKSKESLEKNVKRAVEFLAGSGRFVGRDKP